MCLHLRRHYHVTWLLVAKQLARFLNIHFLDTYPNNSNHHTKPNPNCPNNPRFRLTILITTLLTLIAQITQGFWTRDDSRVTLITLKCALTGQTSSDPKMCAYRPNLESDPKMCSYRPNLESDPDNPKMCSYSPNLESDPNHPKMCAYRPNWKICSISKTQKWW